MPTPDATPTPLDPNAILSAEFNYVAQAAFQANEDRARVSSYFLVSVGAVIGAVFGAKLDGASAVSVNLVFAALFGVLGFVGLTTLLQLARLRAAWEDAAVAMNMIKRFYATSGADAGLDAAFFWKSASLPTGRNRHTVSFLLAVSVMVISSVMAVVALGFWLIALQDGWLAIEAATIGRAGITPLSSAAGDPTSTELVVFVSLAAAGMAAIIGRWEYRLYWSWIEAARERREQSVDDHFAAVGRATPGLADRLQRMRSGSAGPAPGRR